MNSLGGRYLTTAELSHIGFQHVGQDVKIHDRASLYGLENITIGDHVRIDDYAVIIATGSVQIGSYVSIHNYCYLGGTYGITLNDFVTLAPGVKLFSASDDYSGEKLTGPVVPRHLSGGRSGQIVLERHVIVGANSLILPHCTLGEGCAVGALSLVTADLASWGVYAGVPVKRLKSRQRRLIELEQQLRETDK